MTESAEPATSGSGGVSAPSRTDVINTAALYIRPPSSFGGPVVTVQSEGHWGAVLRARDRGTPPAQLSGGYRFSRRSEFAAVEKLDKSLLTASRLDVFANFTVDAQPPTGLHFVWVASRAPRTRFAIVLRRAADEVFSLALQLPGDVVLEDRMMTYDVGSRVCLMASVDLARGLGSITQTGFPRNAAFPVCRKPMVVKLWLGVQCQITLHEFGVWAAGAT